MNTEANKHLAWMLGLLGSITLRDWNQIAGIACATAGFIAACLSIYSWAEKRQRKARELRDLGTTDHGLRNHETTDNGQRDNKRKHHRRTLLWFIVILGLMLTWALIAAAKGKETAGLRTTDYGAGTGQSAAAEPRLGISRDAATATDAWAVQVAEDVCKLSYDFLSGFSWAGLFAAYLGAKGLRNFTPLGRSAGKIGTLLKLMNLEANGERLLASSPTGAALRETSEQTVKTSEK